MCRLHGSELRVTYELPDCINQRPRGHGERRCGLPDLPLLKTRLCVTPRLLELRINEQALRRSPEVMQWERNPAGIGLSGAWRELPVEGRLFESARWLEAERCFQWVDILTSTLYRWDPDTDAVCAKQLGFDFLPLATPHTVLGKQLIADRQTVYEYEWGDVPQPLLTLPVDPEARLNDGIVDANGDLWIGSMGLVPDPARPLGKLWRVGRSGGVEEIATDIVVSNGIAWAETTRGFHIDSGIRKLYSIELLNGRWARRELAEYPPPAEPDGIAVIGGVLWVALWGGSAIRCIADSGTAVRDVLVPVPRPSSIAASPGVVLVTAAGRGVGNDLDNFGAVLTTRRAQFEGRVPGRLSDHHERRQDSQVRAA